MTENLKPLRYGQYTDFMLNDSNNLVIRYTGNIEDTNEFMERVNDGESDVRVFLDIIEDHLCNGWSTISPESVGALTDDTNVLLSEFDYSYFYDTNNYEDIKPFYIYSYPYFAVENYVKALINYGELVFTSYRYIVEKPENTTEESQNFSDDSEVGTEKIDRTKYPINGVGRDAHPNAGYKAAKNLKVGDNIDIHFMWATIKEIGINNRTGNVHIKYHWTFPNKTHTNDELHNTVIYMNNNVWVMDITK